MLQRLSSLKDTHEGFADIETDCHKEFWDAVDLGRYESAEIGLAEITHHRAYSRPKPQDQGHQHDTQGEGNGVRKCHRDAL